MAITSKVGFIGLGIMGRPQALNLIKGGYRLWVHARRPESMQPLIDAGATACASAQAVAEQTEIIFVMVSDTPDVEQVILADNGVIHGARKGAVVADMSTISPTATRSMATRLAAVGVEMLDAPVSGGDVGAIKGTLSIMVGGKAEVFARVKPLLECMGTTIVHIGDNGAGQVAKACNQIAIAITRIAVCEALLFAQRNGVDTEKVLSALMGGLAGSKMMEIQGRRMLDHNFKPGFKLRLQHKDIRIALETAQHLGVALPATALAGQYLNALIGSQDGDLDTAAIAKVVERMNR